MMMPYVVTCLLVICLVMILSIFEVVPDSWVPLSMIISGMIITIRFAMTAEEVCHLRF